MTTAATQSLSAALSRGTSTIGFGIPGVSMSDEQAQKLATLVEDMKEKMEEGEDAPKPHPLVVPTPQPTPFATANPGLTTFDGITARTDAVLNHGGTGEPPDHGLCTGNGYVVQAVNSSIAVYDSATMTLQASNSANAFYQLPPFYDPTTGEYGALLSDPRCLYDADNQRFVVSWLEILFFEQGGGLYLSGSKLHVAVTQTGNPTGEWNLFAWDVSHDGGDKFAVPLCLGDFPQLGADRNGIYVTTNAFCYDLSNGDFNLEAQIYALSKTGLANGTLPQVARLHGLSPFNGGTPISIMPSTQPPGERGQQGQGGVEYLVASTNLYDTTDGLANKVAIYALSNTSSLATNPALRLSRADVSTQSYAFPPVATQKDGPRPLGELFGMAAPYLDTIDGRVNQAMYAREKLWFGLNTAVQTGAEEQRAGIAYFVVEVEPQGRSGVKAEMEQQGYIAPAGQNVMFPATVVTAQGRGAIFFSLAGPDYFPSTAYVTLNEHGIGPLHVASAGVASEDGFSGYDPSYPVARWGDYSAGGVAEDGSLWMATEYIPNQPRTFWTNWGTGIAHLSADGMMQP